MMRTRSKQMHPDTEASGDVSSDANISAITFPSSHKHEICLSMRTKLRSAFLLT
jgi:hypothetical protein